MTNVIVFGPTGKIASVAARTAQDLGAKVFLAMRDTQKTIPGLSAEQEKAGGFERVQADLNKPESVSAAIKTSGAKRAFFYLAFGSPDRMKSTIEALKSAGVEFVVFLSSWMIPGEPGDVPPADLIPYVHGQVEISLDEVYGRENYVALRPGVFATNLLEFKHGIAAGEVKVPGLDWELDAITPEDMGTVAGTILVQGPRNGQHRVYLYGPQFVTNKDAITAIGKAINKDIKITGLNKEESLALLAGHGTPKPFAEYLVRCFHSTSAEIWSFRSCYEEGVKNVELYTGKPAIRFQEWLDANKELFIAS
ncbi:hypothetical protein BX600DRAFT_476954 [Xylariales sp. PMI_506]|nr:hypothetical protein BX600DRAFT_476954 [Xylariales sp. PMI_506]